MIEILWRSMSNDHVDLCTSDTNRARRHERWHGAELDDNSGACVIRFELL